MWCNLVAGLQCLQDNTLSFATVTIVDDHSFRSIRKQWTSAAFVMRFLAASCLVHIMIEIYQETMEVRCVRNEDPIGYVCAGMKGRWG